jgi:hypothetical protein
LKEETEGFINRKMPRERLYLTSLEWTGLTDHEKAEKDFEFIQQKGKEQRQKKFDEDHKKKLRSSDFKMKHKQ